MPKKADIRCKKIQVEQLNFSGIEYCPEDEEEYNIKSRASKLLSKSFNKLFAKSSSPISYIWFAIFSFYILLTNNIHETHLINKIIMYTFFCINFIIIIYSLYLVISFKKKRFKRVKICITLLYKTINNKLPFDLAAMIFFSILFYSAPSVYSFSNDVYDEFLWWLSISAVLLFYCSVFGSYIYALGMVLNDSSNDNIAATCFFKRSYISLQFIIKSFFKNLKIILETAFYVSLVFPSFFTFFMNQEFIRNFLNIYFGAEISLDSETEFTKIKMQLLIIYAIIFSFVTSKVLSFYIKAGLFNYHKKWKYIDSKILYVTNFCSFCSIFTFVLLVMSKKIGNNIFFSSLVFSLSLILFNLTILFMYGAHNKADREFRKENEESLKLQKENYYKNKEYK